MGRRDRHTQEQWDEAHEQMVREPQGSPPPGERPVRIKEKTIDVDMDLMLPPASKLVAPAVIPEPQPKVALDEDAAAIMERVLVVGDLADLTEEERVLYYKSVCKSLGLNPLTRPFAYIVLDGKLTLYARRDCADQLRRLNGISIEIVSKKVVDEVLTVHVRAMDKYGRMDEDIGAVDLYKLDGKNLANAFMKALTKAKRRVTLSISGLGFADESEVEDIPLDREDRPTPRKGRGKAKSTQSVKETQVIQPAKPGEKKPLPPVVASARTVVPIDE